MGGQERGEVGTHRDRTDTGSAATVRDAERFVKIEVTDGGAELARLGQADHRVEICSVDVDLSTVTMHDLAQFTNVCLEHSVRRWVGHHCRRKSIACGCRLRL